ncbi:MAG: Acetoin utilization protein AcuC [Steroidobacteraceae bacterium]|nr:Acetoin utilization protein AcuC [Steroidobacteraceae bacterium]
MLGSRAVAQVLVVMGESIARYGFPEGHPFGVDRHEAFARQFGARAFDSRVRVAAPVPAQSDEILLFHTPLYVDFVRERSATGQGCLDEGDTPAFRGVYEASASVVGATLLAARAIMAGEARRAFVPIAGLHHAARDHAAGFCVFNDIGVAIEVLRREHGLTRIAYVDIDAHHGDGVFYAYEADPQVFVADIHEDGRTLYPGTGAADESGKGAAAGTKLNLPVPAGADDAAFDAAWSRALGFIEAARPEFIILQCGADSIAGDPITHLGFTPAAHGRAGHDLAVLADRLGHGRVLALGGGGYNRANLAAAWNNVVESLAA